MQNGLDTHKKDPHSGTVIRQTGGGGGGGMHLSAVGKFVRVGYFSGRVPVCIARVTAARTCAFSFTAADGVTEHI
jgi:hypothetical protein